MKTLNNIMMSDFVELLCGKLDVVLEDGENVPLDEQREHSHKLMIEYKKIVNPIGIRILLSKHRESSYRIGKINLMHICLKLLSLNGEEDVKDILESIGERVRDLDHDGLINMLRNEIRRLNFEQKRSEAMEKETPKEPESEKDIRSSFDQELAALMVFYKMNIDIRTLSSSVYANMVAMAQKQMKERQKVLNSMKK